MDVVTAKLAKLLLIGEIVILVFALSFGCLEFSHRINNKASLLADSVRNDFMLNDQKSLLQKIQVATISHDFSNISVAADTAGQSEPTDFFSLRNEIPILSIPDDRNSAIVGRVTFTYSILPGIFNGLMLWCIISIALVSFLPFIKSHLQETLSRDLENRRMKELNKIATAVAHDIRSPLSALNSIIHDTSNIPPESREVLVQVSARINGIADDLLSSARNSTPELSRPIRGINLKAALEKVRNEKMLEYRKYPLVAISLRLESLDSAVCANIQDKDLSRVLSNLINNSVEAMKNNGEVIIQAYVRDGRAIIDVIDSGEGISEVVLDKLLREDFSTKKTGNGIGLSSALQIVSRHGGDLKIQSKPNIGTQVTIRIPIP